MRIRMVVCPRSSFSRLWLGWYLRNICDLFKANELGPEYGWNSGVDGYEMVARRCCGGQGREDRYDQSLARVDGDNRIGNCERRFRCFFRIRTS